MLDAEQYLKDHNIIYVLHEHPALFTVEDSEKHDIRLPGMTAKNLFLRGKKGEQYYLLVVPETKHVDLKKFAETIGQKNNLSFGSAEKLLELFGLTPGSVSPLGMINDVEQKVALYIDREVYDAPVVNFHPNRNTASVELTGEMFHRFLEGLGRKVEVVGDNMRT